MASNHSINFGEPVTYNGKAESLALKYRRFVCRVTKRDSFTFRWKPLGEDAQLTSWRPFLCSEVAVDDEANFLLSCEVNLPEESANEVHEPLDAASSWRIKKRIVHPGEVNRTRPLNHRITVSLGDKKDELEDVSSRCIYLWNWDNQPNRQPGERSLSLPDAELKTQCELGEFCLNALTLDSGVSVVGSGGGKEEEGHVAIWRINHGNMTSSKPKSERDFFRKNISKVEDLSFFSRNEGQEFVTVSTNGELTYWDMRDNQAISGMVEKSHDGADANCVDSCPGNEFFVATGGADGVVKVWDQRRSAIALHAFAVPQNNEQIYGVQWQKLRGSSADADPSSILATNSDSGTVVIWDLRKATAKSRVDVGLVSSGIGCNHAMLRHYGLADLKVWELDWSVYGDNPWLVGNVAGRTPKGSFFRIWEPSVGIRCSPMQQRNAIDKQLLMNE
mmetsp:Transcript_11101/g.19002  ORF Transcript_11101/g.19002 Transcript_11101/m.19002 type:complete len:447 (+) Transcript_11101:93-1433(+)